MAASSVGQRFSQLIQQLGMSKNAFALSLDKTATVIQHLVDERNKPGFDLMCKVFEVYPNVSKDWLMQGKGPMMLSDASSPASAAADPQFTSPVAAAKPVAAPMSPAPSFPEPLFSVSAARPPVAEVSAAPMEAAASDIAPAAAPQAASALGAAPPVSQLPTAQSPVPSPGPVVPIAPAAMLDASALTAALHAQYLQHQLALAEQRNQHLLEQQALMQQMLDLMRRTI